MMKHCGRVLIWLGLVTGTFLPASHLWADAKGRVVEYPKIDIDDAYEPKVLGLFIGIQEYDDPFWHDLKYPQKDVRDMVSFFSNNETLNLDEAMILTKPSDTTREAIWENKLKEFSYKNSSEKDVVIVYVSAHGTVTLGPSGSSGDHGESPALEKEPYLLTSDSKEGAIPDTAIPLNRFISWFGSLKSNRKVLILDTCHSGRGGKSQLDPYQAKMLRSTKGVLYKPIEDSWASIILSSCPFGGTSFEDQRLENGVYTHFLLEGMRKGDLDGDGAVSIFEAHNYSIDKTRLFTAENWKIKQVPTAYSEVRGNNPIYVSGKPQHPGVPVLSAYSAESQGVEIYVNCRMKGVFPTGVPMDPGLHDIEFRKNGKTLYSDRVAFKPDCDYLFAPLRNAPFFSKTRTVMMAELGYRGYRRDGMAEDLVPDVPTAGFSFFRQGDVKRWLGFSLGMDFGRGEHVDQTAVRVGPRYTAQFGNMLFMAGPDLMALSFRYSKNTIGDKTVDSTMNFLAPGAEVLIRYDLKQRFSAVVGLRAHRISYSLNDEDQAIMAGQVFLAGGYTF
ncbi:caspase family protein [Desulfatiferula olefinivorans]